MFDFSPFQFSNFSRKCPIEIVDFGFNRKKRLCEASLLKWLRTNFLYNLLGLSEKSGFFELLKLLTCPENYHPLS